MRLVSLFTTAIAMVYAADQPKFEAASAKRMECSMIHNSMGPGTVTLRGDPLMFVLAEAFKVKPYQIVGPSWLETECFEIIAKMPEGATSDQIPAMLQALLAERFKLALHKEDRPGTVYAMVVDKGGPKFKQAEEPSGNFRRGAPPRLMLYRAASDIRGFKGAMTMAMLANSLARGLGRPVHDLTGLQGSYEIDLAWAPDPTIDRPSPNSFAAATPSSGLPGRDLPTATLFTAIRESLGLKLETRKEPVEMLVIDKLERIPIEN